MQLEKILNRQDSGNYCTDIQLFKNCKWWTISFCFLLLLYIFLKNKHFAF